MRASLDTNELLALETEARLFSAVSKAMAKAVKGKTEVIMRVSSVINNFTDVDIELRSEVVIKESLTATQHRANENNTQTKR